MLSVDAVDTKIGLLSVLRLHDLLTLLCIEP